MSYVEITALKKQFAANQVVRGVDLNIERGEFISLLGPSGCGKTTVLRMLAGFEHPTSGNITVEGTNVTTMATAKRGVGMVFQAYALFPNMTVANNVAFGLKVAKKPAGEIKSRVAEMLELIKLPHLGERFPYQLSGGQQQRVALARALAVKPRILLLDEPLSALDAKIRVSLREEIRAVQKKLGITTVFVTHDQEEALSISDRIVVMSEGRIEQLGTPSEIYNKPATRFVASFVGTLTMLQATVANATTGQLMIGGQTLKTAHAVNAAEGATVSLALRPEAIRIGKGLAKSNALSVVVEEVNFLGSIIRIRTRIDAQHIDIDMFNQSANPVPKIGETIVISMTPDDVVVVV